MAQYTINDLTDKYSGFAVPDYLLKINGSEFNKNESLSITDFSVELTAGYEASACTFIINDGFDLADQKKGFYELDDEIKDKIKLGNVVDLYLGYREDAKKTALEKVFSGYISTIDFNFNSDEGFSLDVECLDVKGLMMNNIRSELKKDIKKYSEVVHEILKNYAKLIGKQFIDSSENRIIPIEQSNQSDYDFIVNLAKRINYAFYVVNSDVYFQPVGKDTNSLLELTIGDLISFTRETTLAEQIAEVTVRINNELDPHKPFEYTVDTFKTIGKGKKSSAEISKLINKKFKKTIIDPTIGSTNEAKTRATAELMRNSLKFAAGTFECIGIPEVIPGKILTIKGFGEDYDNDYFIKKVTHQFGKNSYITKGDLGVNKI